MIAWTFALSLALMAAAGAAAAPPAQEVPLYEGLGPHTRQVSTSSQQAQTYFNQGLSFLFAFNHDEAIRSFARAAEIDPGCAMAWWGIAAANGPHINNPVVPPERSKAAMEALKKARAAAGGASEVEKALIQAQSKRYADPPPDDRASLDKAYADAMRDVWKRFPRDVDAGAMFAESLMDLRPWDLWTVEGEPQPETPEILATLEDLMAKDPQHPLAMHLYIHAVEASPHPERADAAADGLRDLEPGLGHMVHMPSHIDVRRGRWEQAITANRKAIEADRVYRERSPRQNFYRVYMAHNHHMLGFAAMMIGRSADAIAIMDKMVAGIPADWAKESGIADGFMAMPIEVRVRPVAA
jgi:tetratricopeptide (TPR) repeat protein